MKIRGKIQYKKHERTEQASKFYQLAESLLCNKGIENH
jgi:hypothetical protein